MNKVIGWRNFSALGSYTFCFSSVTTLSAAVISAVSTFCCVSFNGNPITCIRNNIVNATFLFLYFSFLLHLTPLVSIFFLLFLLPSAKSLCSGLNATWILLPLDPIDAPRRVTAKELKFFKWNCTTEMLHFDFHLIFYFALLRPSRY